MAAVGTAVLSRSVIAHDGMGPVEPPVLAPDLILQDHHGQARRLRALLQGNVTLLQTIFTACSSICPLQGALFAEAQRRIQARAPREPVQWLSVSIDALSDTPDALARWLADMGAGQPGWLAAVPRAADVPVLQAMLDGVPEGEGKDERRPEGHSDRVYLFDMQAQLRWRTGPLPAVEQVLRIAQHHAE
jgi:protein SCO1/2